MSDWTQAICEADWIKQRSKYEDGALVEIERPTRLNQEYIEVERCAWCGGPTIFGVYVRVDPKTVPYAVFKKEETT